METYPVVIFSLQVDQFHQVHEYFFKKLKKSSKVAPLGRGV